jgi:hypothetical protein
MWSTTVSASCGDGERRLEAGDGVGFYSPAGSVVQNGQKISRELRWWRRKEEKRIWRSRPSVPDTIVGGDRAVAELRRGIAL